MHRFDPRKVLRAGVLGIAFSFYQIDEFKTCRWVTGISFGRSFIQGVSIGLVAVPLMVLTMGFHFQGEDGERHSLFNMMRNIGGGIGISLVGTMLTRLGAATHQPVVAKITPFSPSAMRLLSVSGVCLRVPARFWRPSSICHILLDWCSAKPACGAWCASSSISAPGSHSDFAHRLDKRPPKVSLRSPSHTEGN